MWWCMIQYPTYLLRKCPLFSFLLLRLDVSPASCSPEHFSCGRQGTKHWNSHFSTFEQSFSWDGWRHQTMLQNRGTQTCQEQSWDCTCGRESRAAAIAANVGTSDSLKWAQMLKCRLWIFFETSKLWLKWIGISLSLNKHRLGGKLLAEGMSNQACSSSRFEK